jgi:PAS domain S-box-containing protein
MEASNILVVGIDRRSRITFFNKGCEATTGYSSEDIVGKSFAARLISTEQRKSIRQQLRDLTESNTSIVFVSAVVTQAGETRTIQWAAAPVLDVKGSLKEIICYGTDITDFVPTEEKARMEEALRESEEKYRLLVERSLQGTVILLGDPLKIEFANDAFTQMLDYTVEELSALSPSEVQALVHPEDREQAFARAAARFRGESLYERWEFRMFRKDGTIMWMEVYASRIDYHRKSAIQATFMDITERKRAEEALQASEARWRSLVECAPDLIVMVDQEGVIQFLNRTATQQPVEDAIGRTVYDFVSPEFHETQKHVLQQVFRTGESTRFEVTAPGPNNTLAWYQSHIGPVLQNGKVIAAIQIARDVTVQKEAEMALQDSEAKYRALVEQTIQGILIVRNTPNPIYFANATIAEMLGYTVEELTSGSYEGLLVLLHPEDREHTLAQFRRRMEGGREPPRFEVRMVHKDESIIWVEAFSTRIDLSGEPAVLSTFVDITEHKHAEEAYRELVENSLQGIVVFQDGRIVFANSALSETFGYSQEELQRLSPDQVQKLIYPGEGLRLWERHRKRMAGEDVPRRFEVRGFRKDGSEVWVETFISRIEYRGRSAVQAAVVDITERKQMEIALRESEEKYREIAEKSFQAITVFQEGRVAYANQSASELLDMSLEEFFAMGAMEWANYIHPDDRELVLERFRARVEGQDVPRRYEFRIISPKGRLKWVEVLANRIHWEGHVAIQAIMLDITERMHTEQALREAQARAEFFNDLMAHDLTNIHQGILSLLELTLREPDLSSTPTELISQAVMQLRRGADLIAKVRRFGQLDVAPLALMTIDLANPLNQAVEAVRGSYPHKELLLRTSIAPDKHYVLAGEFLTDVFYNLLHNAMKFDRQKRVKVTVNARKVKEYYQIEVIDYGSGITDIEKVKIFARFGTTDTDSHRLRGRGIGLTLVQRIVSHYSGKIWVEDRVPGDYKQGAKFVFLLPHAT